MVPKTCSIPECNNAHKGHGLCNMHLKRLRKNGHTGDPRKTTEQRFWEKVNKSGSAHPFISSLGSCWEWTAAKSDGYGVVALPDGRGGWPTKRAHRYVWELLIGPIGVGLLLDHTCFNRACVNPDHLREVTNKENLENREGAQERNPTGVRGVFINRQGRYVARVGHNWMDYHVGTFDTLEEAESAIIAKRNELHTHNLIDRAA